MALAWKVRDLLRFSGLTGNYRTQSMNKNIIRLAAIAALAVGAQAAIVKSATSPSVGFTVGGASTGGFQASTFSGGDIVFSVDVPTATALEIAGHGGTLVGISYTINYGGYAVYNLTDTALYQVQWGTGPAGIVGTGPFGGSPGINFGVADIDSSFVNGIVVGSTTAQNTATTGALSDTANLGSYVAANGATVNFAFTADTFSSVGGGATSQSQPEVFAGATVTITYTFSDVPEPSTYAAGAVLLAGAGFIARRRMQKA